MRVVILFNATGPTSPRRTLKSMADNQHADTYSEQYIYIEDLVKRIQSGEVIKCKTTFPSAALVVLWACHIVTCFQWQWRAVKKDWWETLAIADPDNKYVILPVQFMRGVASSRKVERWPHEIIDAIAQGRLPDSQAGGLLRIA